MALRADLLKPIPGDNPSGANLRYDPVIDKIKEARREDVDAPQGAWKTTVKTADYPQVIKLASDVITKRSKDLQIAVWLVEAHIRREGLAIAGACFDFIHKFLEEFWDTFYPEIEDGDVELRAGPLEWLGSKMEVPVRLAPITASGLNFLAYKESRIVGYEADVGDSYEKQEARRLRIEEGKLTAEDFDAAVDATPMGFYGTTLSAVNDALAEIEGLGVFCDERFGDEAPGFGNTRKALEDVGQLLEIFLRKKGGAVPVRNAGDEDDELSESAEESSSDSASSYTLDDVSFSFDAAGSSADAGDSQVDTDSSSDSADTDNASSDVEMGEPQSEEQVVKQLASICRYLRTKDPQDVAPFLILRGYRWGKLRTAAPPIDANLFVPPPTDLRIKLKQLLNTGDWEPLINTAEEALTLPCSGPWIDLHRYSIYGLEEMGMYAAANAIRSELKGLLADLPQLNTATLFDDTPTISAETRKWIDTDLMLTKEERDAARSGSSSDDSSSSDSDSYSSDDSSSSSDSSYDSSDSSDSGSSDSSDDSSSDTSSSADETPAVEEAPPMEFPAIDEDPPILEEFPADVTEDNRDLFEVARDTVKGGNASEGLKLITDRLANERSNRGRFKRRTQIAHLLMDSGHAKVAEPLLDQLASEIDDRRLEEWEDGEIVAYPLELLLRCVAPDGTQVERRMQLYSRLCKLDPVRAMGITF